MYKYSLIMFGLNNYAWIGDKAYCLTKFKFYTYKIYFICLIFPILLLMLISYLNLKIFNDSNAIFNDISIVLYGWIIIGIIYVIFFNSYKAPFMRTIIDSKANTDINHCY